MDENAPKDETLDFEGALARLEEVTRSLERGDLALEQSLALFEEGMRLASLCSKRLDAAEQRVEALLGTKDGPRTAPFTPAPGGADEGDGA